MDLRLSCFVLLSALAALCTSQSLSESHNDDSKNTRILLYQMAQDIAEVKSILRSVLRDRLKEADEDVEAPGEMNNHRLMDQMRKLLLLKNMAGGSNRLAVKRDPPVGFYAVRGKRDVSA